MRFVPVGYNLDDFTAKRQLGSGSYPLCADFNVITRKEMFDKQLIYQFASGFERNINFVENLALKS